VGLLEIIKKAAMFYSHRVLPRIRHIRGTTRISLILKKLALRNQEKISEKEAESIFKEDWDNLILLDACRHDTYEEVMGETDHRYSLGSATPEYISETFSEGDYSDVVYITANPHFYETIFKEKTGRKPEEVFHTVYNTYETDWNEEEGVVLPEPLIRDAKNARKLFPDKKIIVHFMQPHDPFVTSDIKQNPNKPLSPESSVDVDEGHTPEPELAEEGEIDRETVLRHYRENLEYVMDEVEEFVEEMEGKTVITSDHGEMMDENGFYGHPEGFKVKSLRKVPWDVREK
jgi:arylsulfatase A-like enzyme